MIPTPHEGEQPREIQETSKLVKFRLKINEWIWIIIQHAEDKHKPAPKIP